MSGEWTIGELGEAAERALGPGFAAANGQVSAIPDTRTIRYYTTLGLLDRPAAMRGRIALYGRRHLLQLVAIKRLQAEGRSLAEIQEALSGLSDAGLAKLAGPLEGPEPAEAPARARFWAAEPVEPPETLAVGVPLEAGLTLLFTPARALDAADLDSLREAAEPLVRLLEDRGLLSSGKRG